MPPGCRVACRSAARMSILFPKGSGLRRRRGSGSNSRHMRATACLASATSSLDISAKSMPRKVSLADQVSGCPESGSSRSSLLRLPSSSGAIPALPPSTAASPRGVLSGPDRPRASMCSSRSGSDQNRWKISAKTGLCSGLETKWAWNSQKTSSRRPMPVTMRASTASTTRSGPA